jgi:hypothetical protein
MMFQIFSKRAEILFFPIAPFDCRLCSLRHFPHDARIMRPLLLRFTLPLLLALPFAQAKDEPVDFAKCPAPVQAVIEQYKAQGKLEAIGLDHKKKAGGVPVYEAKFTLPEGKRIEVHISPEGKVLEVEDKKPKKAE